MDRIEKKMDRADTRGEVVRSYIALRTVFFTRPGRLKRIANLFKSKMMYLALQLQSRSFCFRHVFKSVYGSTSDDSDFRHPHSGMSEGYIVERYGGLGATVSPKWLDDGPVLLDLSLSYTCQQTPFGLIALLRNCRAVFPQEVEISKHLQYFSHQSYLCFKIMAETI